MKVLGHVGHLRLEGSKFLFLSSWRRLASQSKKNWRTEVKESFRWEMKGQQDQLNPLTLLYFTSLSVKSVSCELKCNVYQSQCPLAILWLHESSAHLAATSQGFHRMGKFFSSFFTEQRVGVSFWAAVLFFFSDPKCFVICCCARWTLRLLPGHPNWVWHHVVKWDEVIATEPSSVTGHPNQSHVIHSSSVPA